MSSFTEFLAPETVGEAVAILRELGASARVLAGGTDLMIRIRRGEVRAGCTTLVSVHRIAGMRGCRREDGDLVIGAATTPSALIRDGTIAACAPILATVSDCLASAQIRNVATIGGNLVNASPAGDLINPLLLLDAWLVIASAEGRRTVPVEAFFTGPGRTVLRPGELLVEIRAAVPPRGRIFRFRKAGTRPAMDCSVVTAGLAFTPRADRLTTVRAAFGALAPTPLRGRRTEAVLEGARPTPEVAGRAACAAEREVSPISDVRGSARYRRALVGVFVKRLLDGAACSRSDSR